MAVPEQTPYIEHTGNGVTTSFALKFQCESKDHLIVLVDGIEPPIATWSLTGGNVVFTTAPANGQKITLQRNTPFNRTTDYQSYNNSFRPPAVNKDFDWIWWKLQELGVADWVLGARIDALKNYVDRKDDELKAYLMEEIRKQGVALDQLDEYYNRLMQKLAEIALEGGWTDSVVATWSGRTQEEKNRDFVTVEDYGAIGDGILHKLSEKYASLAAAKFAYYNIQDRIVSLDQSIDWAAFQSSLATNSAIYAVKPVYVLNDALIIPKGTRLLGAGVDVWDMASVTGKPNKMERGTTLLFVGSPFKKINIFGVTRNKLTGGVITNPSPLPTEFATYELTDLTNRDASGTTSATLRDLKCGVVLEEASNASLRDIRILKSYNGIDGYNDASLVGIGDDYDIGLLVFNSSFVDIYNVQSIGYWKLFGGLQVNSEHKSVGISKMGEGTFNLYSKCFFQGLTGFGFRGADEHLVLSRTSTTFTVPYDESNLIEAGDNLTNGGAYFDVVSTAVSGNTLVITTNTTPPNVGNLLRHVRYNFGVAGVQMRDCIVTGIFHKSRLSAKAVGLTKNSCGLEISGGILRDIDFDNVHIFDGECIAYISNVDDVNFKGSYFEANGVREEGVGWNPSGVRFIVNGATGDSSATYPIEGCKNLTFDQSTEVAATVDLHPYNIIRPARFTDEGLFKPHSFVIDAHGSQTVNRLPKSRSETIISSTGLYPAQRNIRFIDPYFKTLARIWEDARMSIGDIAAPQGRLHLYTPASETASSTHDIVVDSPLAGSQFRSRNGGRWWRMLADGASGFKLTYSTGQTSAYTINALQFNPDASTPELAVGGNLRPASDNAYSLGTSISRWSTIYAGTGTINTSDERLKQQFRSLEEREKAAALEVKNSICLFKFNDAVDLKGDGARWHCGVKAQQVISILESHDLNPFDYGFVCFDEWDELPQIVDDFGNLVQEYRPAGSRYAVRYDELTIFILAAL